MSITRDLKAQKSKGNQQIMNKESIGNQLGIKKESIENQKWIFCGPEIRVMRGLSVPLNHPDRNLGM